MRQPPSQCSPPGLPPALIDLAVTMLHSSPSNGYLKPRRSWQHAPATHQAACLRFVVRAQAAGVVEGAAAQPNQPTTNDAKQRKLKLNVFQPKHEINWNRWELVMLQMIEAQEAAAAAQGGSAAEQEEQIEELPAGSDDAWEGYFRQYDNPAVHLPRLSDSAYVAAWAEAIKKLAPDHIKDKVVVDVGCGPGLLSVMCAKAGAKKVIAVDGSKAMAAAAKQVAEDNGLSSVIEVVHARVEEVRLKEKADVLVCNWPGQGLLAGGMLQSVAYARQHLLKTGGLVLPSTASISVTGIEDRAALSNIKQAWSDVGGINLSGVMTQVVLTPRVTTLQRQSQLCTSTAQVVSLQVGDITRPAARAGVPPTPFQLTCQRDERLFGLILHFDLGFGASGASKETDAAAPKPVLFSTHPKSPSTSFQQLVLNFPRSIKVNKGDVLEGTLSLQPSGLQGRDVLMDLRVSYAGVTAGVQYTLVHSVPLGAHVAQAIDL